MTKQELTIRIAAKSGITTDVVKTIIDLYTEEIINCLAKGEDYFQRGFGSFIVRKTAPKVGFDISRQKPVDIPAAYKPKFLPSKQFIAIVKGGNQK